MKLHTKAALVIAMAAVGPVTAVASAHVVSQTDPRRDAEGTFDLRSTSLQETSGFRVIVTAQAYNRIPGRTPGMPCLAFDYKSGSAADRVACPVVSGRKYELREARSGRVVARLAYTRPNARTIRVAVPGRLLSGNRGLRWRAFIEGSGDKIADDTRWRNHRFSD